MELKIIWEIILRRKWIVIQAFLVIFLTAIIGSFFMTPVYEVSAKVLIKTSDTASSLLSSIGLEGFKPSARGRGAEIETPIELALVEPLLEEIISKLQLRTGDGNLMKPGDIVMSNFILSKIFPKPYVEAKPVEDTNLIIINARSTDPEEAAMIANTLAEVYIEENLRQRKVEYKSAREFIEDRIKLVKAAYINALDEIKKFNIREKTIDLKKETETAIDKMAELMKKKTETIINLSEVMAKIETLKTQLSKESETIVSSSTISENPQIEALKKTLSDLKLQLAGALTEKRPDHPDVVALNTKIKTARAELRKEIVIFKELSGNLQNLERELAASEAHLKSIDTEIESQTFLLYAIPEKAFTESQLKLKYNVNQDLYNSLLEYFYQVGIAEAMAISDIRLVEAATVPDIDKPKSPKKVLNGIMGVFLGLMFGFGLGLFVDYLDDSIKTPEEAKKQGLTLLGFVPKFKRKESTLILRRDPKDPISEAYRTIRNSLKFASLDKPLNSLSIMSSIDGEGKTTTMVNLGISTTREGKSVLLVDTDLRKPQLHVLCGVSNSIGITSILAADVKPANAIKKSDIEGLSLLTSGPVPPDPGGIIESAKMRQLIKDLAQQYDTIIFDSCPILISNDAIVIAGYVDSSILVLESGRTTQRALSQARELLKQANIQPIGAVLNKFRIRGGGYYYYNTGYYKGKKK